MIEDKDLPDIGRLNGACKMNLIESAPLLSRPFNLTASDIKWRSEKASEAWVLNYVLAVPYDKEGNAEACRPNFSVISYYTRFDSFPKYYIMQKIKEKVGTLSNENYYSKYFSIVYIENGNEVP